MPLGVRALRAYLDARLNREKRELYMGDLLWLSAIKMTNLDDVQSYSAFCSELERGYAQGAETAQTIYERVMAQLREGGG